MDFGFLWYIGIGVAVLLTLFAYRTKRSITRMTEDQVSELNRVLGTDFGVTLMGCVAFGVVFAFVYNANPGAKALKTVRRQHMLARYRAVGEVLGKELADATKTKSTGLLVLPPVRGVAQEYQNAVIKGLKEGCGNKINFKRREVLSSDKEAADPELEQAKNLVIRSSELSGFAARNKECTVVVCLMDITPDYPGTPLAADVKNANKLMGLVTGDPYMLGLPLSQGQITACVVPKTGLRNEVLPPDASVKDRFDQAYWLVTPGNLKDIIKLNKRMFYLLKRVED